MSSAMFRRLIAAFLILVAIAVVAGWRNPDRWKNRIPGPWKDRIKEWYATLLSLKSLKLPPGFAISVFVKTESPRMLAFSPGGTLLATSASGGTVAAFPDPQHSGRASARITVLADLNGPHGIAFHGGHLYIAEITRLVRYDWDEAHLRATNAAPLTKLPESGQHITRMILFANDKLYVSVGSSCNVCVESDPRRATVSEMNEDGSDAHIFASGLRNAVGLTFNERTGTVWATDNGATGWVTIYRRTRSTILALVAATLAGRIATVIACPTRASVEPWSAAATQFRFVLNCRPTPRRWGWCFTKGRCFRPNIRETYLWRSMDPGTSACPPVTK